VTTSPAGTAERDVPHRLLPGLRVGGLLLLIVAAAFLIRFDALHNDAPAVPAFGDGHNYHVIAAALAEGKGFVRPIEYERQDRRIATAEYPPALPALLAVGDKLGVDGETGQRTLLCIAGAITVGLTGLVARRLAGDAAGLLAAVLAAVHPGLVNNDVSLAAEPLSACVGAAVMLAALAVWDRGSVRRWLVLGGLLGLGCLVRAEFLLLVPVLIGGLAWRQAGVATQGGSRGGRWSSAVRAGGMGLVATVVVLMPWTARNAAAFHRFVPVSNNLGSVLRGANCGPAYHGQFKGLWVESLSTQTSSVDPHHECFTGFDIHQGSDEAQAAGTLRTDGLSFARHHAGDLPGVVAVRLGRTVGLYRFVDQSNFARLEGRSPARERVGTRTFQLFLIIGVAGLVAGGWRHRERWIPVAVIAAVLVTVMVTYGNPRFRATAEPAVVVLAAVAVVEFARRWVRLPGSQRQTEVHAPVAPIAP
jgi:hypothetical protein